MNQAAQRACAISGIGVVVLFFVGFWAVAGFIPPPPPTTGAASLAELFRDDRDRIRVGLLIATVAAALLVPWSAVLALQLSRIEGRRPVLSLTQFGLGAILALEFSYLLFFWLVATYRADRDPGQIQLLNDMAWIPFVGLVFTGMLQALCIGVVILRDTGHPPVFPRWAGYANVWIALMYLLGALNVFFQEGPFAWNGLLAFYLVLYAFTGWLLLNSYLALGAVRTDRPDARSPLAWSAGAEPDAHDLVAQMAEMRTALARLSRK
jgi:hypothetical protein